MSSKTIQKMIKKSPVAIFMAATALLATSSLKSDLSLAGSNEQKMGGLKEWTTDQDVNEESSLDEAAKKEAEEAKKNDICIPIGEGENCW
tara:strand:- start:36 stop:305 length:270 start_codon:yes stop_codon:yes gene_type:complete